MKKILLPLLALSCMVAQAQLDPNRTVMTVNGEEVKAREYYTRMEFLPGVGRMLSADQFEESAPGLLVLQLLMEERLVLQLAKSKGVEPTAAEVEEEFQRKRDRDPAFFDKWKQMGLTEDDFRYQARLDAAQFKLITMGVNITDLEVTKHYDGNTSLFTEPRRMKLRVIAASSEANRKSIDAELAKPGKTFGDVAKAMSEDIVTKADGGDLGTVAVRDFNESVRTALEAAKIGAATPWLQGSNTWIKLFKEDVVPEKKRPLDADLRKQIRRSLMVDRGMVKNDYEKMLREFRKQAKIELRQMAFKDEFGAFLRRVGVGAR